MKWVLSKRKEAHVQRFESSLLKARFDLLPPKLFEHPNIHLEIGAGTGWMIFALAKRNPENFYIAVERDRMRGNRLVSRSERAAIPNLAAFRGNVVPALIHGVPDQKLDRIYIMYPCPFLKSSQRKHRWYLHPAMNHFVRALKPGGLIVWASDQRFYIDEAAVACREMYGLEILSHGELVPNEWNHLLEFPAGRTKFENAFLSSGQACHELIVRKPHQPPTT